MLRRKPTAITLTSEDVAAYEDSRRAAAVATENANNPYRSSFGNESKTAGIIDPNDELKPLPGDKARIVRPGGPSRDDRIVGR